MNSCADGGDKYTDNNFPPAKKSLIEAGVNPGKTPYGRMEWIRANNIAELNDDEGDLAIFADGVTPNDIR